ncbi:MAG: thioredoxin family protein [Pseudolysinimonas sp.]
MNKRVLAVGVTVAVLIVGGLTAYALTRPAEPTGLVQAEASPSVAPATEGADPTTSPSSGPATAGTYIDYDGAAVANAEGTVVLLFFYAPWCPQCRSIESDILAEGVHAGVTIVKVDYDSHQDLRQQYGVTLQTTFVEVDGSGTALQKYVAYEDPHLSAVVAAML